MTVEDLYALLRAEMESGGHQTPVKIQRVVEGYTYAQDVGASRSKLEQVFWLWPSSELQNKIK
jgi:hypothetical protein